MPCLCGKKVERSDINKVTCSSCAQFVHAKCYKVGDTDMDTFRCLPCENAMNSRRNSLRHSPPITPKRLLSADGSLAIVATATSTSVTSVVASVASSGGTATATAASGGAKAASLSNMKARGNASNAGINNINNTEDHSLLFPNNINLMALIEAKLNQQAEYFSHVLEAKLKQQSEYFEGCVKKVEVKLMQRLSSIAADISNLTTKVQDVEKRCNNFDKELEHIKVKLSVLENSSVAADFVIRNIPNNLETSTVVSKLLNTITCPVQPVNVFRANNKLDTVSNVPIIVKLQSASDRSTVFRCIATFRKKHNRQLTLADCGGVNILVHESISSYNRDILNRALAFKRDNILHSVYTLRGWVYVRKIKDGNSMKIPDMDALYKLVGDINVVA